MSERPARSAWRYAMAGVLAAAIALASALWFRQQDSRDAGGAESASAHAPAALPVPPSGAVAASAAALPVIPGSAPLSPAQVNDMFVAAVRNAREAPRPPPPPGIARAKSFEEAFEAMRAAQPEPANPSAGSAALNPFGAAR